MTDQQPDEQPDEPAEPQEPVRTGNPQVDTVLASLDALEGAPIEEHVAVFERAHEQLRGALDAQPSRPAVQPGAPRPAEPRSPDQRPDA